MHNREYYLLKLYNGGKTVNVNGVELPIVGVFVNNNMYLLVNGEKITPLFEGIRPNHLTYETVTMLDPKGVEVSSVMSLNNEEIEAYIIEIVKIKLSILNDYCNSEEFKGDINLSLRKDK